MASEEGPCESVGSSYAGLVEPEEHELLAGRMGDSVATSTQVAEAATLPDTPLAMNEMKNELRTPPCRRPPSGSDAEPESPSSRPRRACAFMALGLLRRGWPKSKQAGPRCSQTRSRSFPPRSRLPVARPPRRQATPTARLPVARPRQATPTARLPVATPPRRQATPTARLPVARPRQATPTARLPVARPPRRQATPTARTTTARASRSTTTTSRVRSGRSSGPASLTGASGKTRPRSTASFMSDRPTLEQSKARKEAEEAFRLSQIRSAREAQTKEIEARGGCMLRGGITQSQEQSKIDQKARESKEAAELAEIPRRSKEPQEQVQVQIEDQELAEAMRKSRNQLEIDKARRSGYRSPSPDSRHPEASGHRDPYPDPAPSSRHAADAAAGSASAITDTLSTGGDWEGKGRS
ncbi:unnamed protein product [Prorocentrum cordatum]|uniref:Uncharacterized protein n=1 Tax=Prorocentrum cordatum TaxID=2364126 RepID=A0ABN9QIG2_9DINO|nr:unnamed protein product [Polarella glacialis]